MQPAPMPMPQTAFRPIVATIVMVLLLYSLFSGDWAAPANHSRRTDLRQLGFPEAPRAEEFPSIHEKVGHQIACFQLANAMTADDALHSTGT